MFCPFGNKASEIKRTKGSFILPISICKNREKRLKEARERLKREEEAQKRFHQQLHGSKYAFKPYQYRRYGYDYDLTESDDCDESMSFNFSY